jgi:hypothetical protein
MIVDTKILWCHKCGAVREMFQNKWTIPLDRVGDIARSVQNDEEPPTLPGTPQSKSGLMRAMQVPPRKTEE